MKICLHESVDFRPREQRMFRKGGVGFFSVLFMITIKNYKKKIKNYYISILLLMRRNNVVKKNNLHRLSKQPDSTTDFSHQEKS
jgi:hypothetical protein